MSWHGAAPDAARGEITETARSANRRMSFRIVILAKAPVAGFAKTRLIPALGAQGAAKLAEQLLRHAVEQAIGADIGQVEICVTPHALDPVWQRLALPASLVWSSQTGGDLGQRLSDPCQRVIREGEVPILMGTDCPALSARILRGMSQTLQHQDACMVPVGDGGYAALGVRFFDGGLFREIPWSTPAVASLTRERLRAAGRTWHELAPLHDIDEPVDLHWLPDGWQPGK